MESRLLKELVHFYSCSARCVKAKHTLNPTKERKLCFYTGPDFLQLQLITRYISDKAGYKSGGPYTYLKHPDWSTLLTWFFKPLDMTWHMLI